VLLSSLKIKFKWFAAAVIVMADVDVEFIWVGDIQASSLQAILLQAILNTP
jgi:hypothetical protein